MAEYDPLDPPTYGDTPDDGASESYDPSQHQQNGGDEAEQDEDYDPSSINYGESADSDTIAVAQPGQPSIQTPSQTDAPSKPPQKVAGFIVEESDDEQEQDASAPPPPSQLNGDAGSHSGLGAVAVSEAEDVNLSSAPQDDTAASATTSLNGSTTVPVLESSSSNAPPDLTVQPPEQGKTVSPVASAQASVQASVAPTPVPAAETPAAATPAPQQVQQPPPQTNGAVQQPPARLPHDKVGQLEDRIKDDPKGDTDAWSALIDHYFDKGQYDYAREVYERMLKVFPTAVVLWVGYIAMEKKLDETDRIVHILNKCLMQIPNVDLWKFYMDHVRRALPLINDTNGVNRAELMKAWDMTFDHVGIDPAAGQLWREYIDFMKDGPGSVGGTGWQDMQKADLLRAAYQRAIKIPNGEFMKLWKEYEAFEHSLNRQTARKHIQEQSQHYMEARKAKVQLDQKLDGLDRSSLPQLPPIYGFAGEEQFGDQVEKWRAWIAWERDEDPLVFKGTEDDKYRQRVIYAYRQATMFLTFYPEIWYDAASWCFTQPQLESEGEQFLEKGIAANPESVLLALLKADRIEANLATGNTDDVLIANGEKLDVPFEGLLTALYTLVTKTKQKDKFTAAQIQEHYNSLPPEDEQMENEEADDDEDASKPKTRQEQMQAELDAAKSSFAAQLDTLKRTISYAWVAKMRAFRRVQGQGKPAKKGADPNTKVVKGFRGIFVEARPRGMLSSAVYIASALMEWHGYRDGAAERIFQRGAKLFPEDHIFILEYVKHMINVGDITNARVVFKGAISKLNNAERYSLEQRRKRCRPLLVFMHDWESKYGDYAEIVKNEALMAKLYPEEPEINRFSHRSTLPDFDAVAVQLLLSPTQARPKTDIPQVLAPEQNPLGATSPRAQELILGPNGPYLASPKRPLDDSDADTSQRTKFMRAESPLKGNAGNAGVRINKGSATVPTGNVTHGGGFATKTFVPGGLPPGPPPIPPKILEILGALPPARSYTGTRLDPLKIVPFLATVNVDHAKAMYQAGQLPQFPRAQ
ncbi:mRNA 3'-end-processing protein rna14 [Fulvia fulva]|uniref:mRNA 3'-end-processing protein RNA14 n=1 Tax=Passalora fulva TaxID=5499 RepID=A0A9Q8PK33_PASFU|nr:mRNA 3'-end-processing protein rna14 [Fulvia fulva]KAK4612177.1 mRNA 3'-end-processing protein rna14 [Fulvia fulva]UJO23896.1 mRNA 3'-end-processing protein rna14 [Fulvia fulva]WPV21668.1 mRNA 3'-end-processing protein rna14 [Fulvia fulva]WPV36156.1 mRNA 3'-end-processing protein rna14 [Fulvia fulva]